MRGPVRRGSAHRFCSCGQTASTCGLRIHSSSICEGASTKSASMLMPLMPGPLLLAAEDVVHQVAELVEERHDVTVLHETGIGGRRVREVADQNGLGKLLAAHAVEHREPFRRGCTCRDADACRDRSGRWPCRYR